MPSPGITKRYLAQAIKTLMADRPLSKISVGDIVEYCGLNRNSFYYHFRDKYDLVNWIFYTEIVTKLREQQGELTSGWALIEKICEYLYDEKDFYVSALSETGQDSFPAYFSQVMRTMVLAHAEEMEEEFREFAATFFVDAFLATITRWLCEGAKIPPHKLVEQMKLAVDGSIRLLRGLSPRE